MKKESTTLIVSVVVILIIALVGFNFQSITGYQVSDIKSDTRIDVYPKTDLDAGEYINVEIFPGSKCVDRRAYIYYAAGTGAKATVQPSGTSKQKLCDPYTLTYKTQAVWGENPGVYYVKVFDFGTKDFVKDVFVIRGEE